MVGYRTSSEDLLCMKQNVKQNGLILNTDSINQIDME